MSVPVLVSTVVCVGGTRKEPSFVIVGLLFTIN